MFQTHVRLLRSSAVSRIGAATLVAMALSIGLAPSAHATVLRDEGGHHHARYYLALGASYAFGYQEARINAELAAGTYQPGFVYYGLCRRLCAGPRRRRVSPPDRQL